MVVVVVEFLVSVWDSRVEGAVGDGVGHSLGSIFPVLSVSTRRTNGRMERTLWCDENGVSQWTVRLWIHTTSVGRLIGRIQSMRIRIECA